MAIPVVEISAAERDKIMALAEGHFADLKDIRITPSKLTRTLSALSNAEGGEVYIGIREDVNTRTRSWNGFNVPEDANSHIQVFEQLFPLGDGYEYTFLRTATEPGHVLKVEVAKNRDVKTASDGVVYLRRGAQNLPVTAEEALTRLRRYTRSSPTQFSTATIVSRTIFTLGFSTTGLRWPVPALCQRTSRLKIYWTSASRVTQPSYA